MDTTSSVFSCVINKRQHNQMVSMSCKSINLKQKTKKTIKNPQKILPTDPNFEGNVTRNTNFFRPYKVSPIYTMPYTKFENISLNGSQRR